MCHSPVVEGFIFCGFHQKMCFTYLKSTLIEWLLFLTLGGCFFKSDESLNVFSAAGAKPALDSLCCKFHKSSGIKVEVNYGGGGEVLSRIILARKGDVFIAPEQKFMLVAKREKVVIPSSVRVIAYMAPVLAVRKGNPEKIAGIKDLGVKNVRIGVTRKETTLLGRLAPQILKRAGLVGTVEEKVVITSADPNSILTMLAMGNIDVAFLWNFYGVSAHDKVDVIYIPPEFVPEAGKMEAAVTTFSDKKDVAMKFVKFLASKEAKTILRLKGYITSVDELKNYIGK